MSTKQFILLGAFLAAFMTVMTFGKDLMTAGGFRTESPIDRLGQLEADLELAEEVHSTHHAAEQAMWTVQRLFSDSITASKDSSRRQRTGLIEALVRGECLENSRDNLALQGLSAKCQDLGIVPRDSLQ